MRRVRVLSPWVGGRNEPGGLRPKVADLLTPGSKEWMRDVTGTPARQCPCEGVVVDVVDCGDATLARLDADPDCVVLWVEGRAEAEGKPDPSERAGLQQALSKWPGAPPMKPNAKRGELAEDLAAWLRGRPRKG